MNAGQAMNADIVVVALGARTPVGRTAESAAAAVRAGICRVCEHEFMVDAAGEPLKTAYDAGIDVERLGSERLAPLATSALEEVASKVAAVDPRLAFSVVLAFPEPRPGLTASDLAKAFRDVQRDAAERGVRGIIEPSDGAGHAGGVRAFEVAIHRLLRREADLVAVGGADTYLQVDTLTWLESGRRLARTDIRSGFHPGEAAGFVLLTSGQAAMRRGLPVLARIRGVATAVEERALTTGKEVLGQGLAAAIARACAILSLPGERVDTVYCDINGERYRSEEWAMTALRIPHVMRGEAYECPADSWGDVGAASAPLGCVLAIRSWARSYAKGPRALVWASSDGGLRGAVVLEGGR